MIEVESAFMFEEFCDKRMTMTGNFMGHVFGSATFINSRDSAWLEPRPDLDEERRREDG